MIRGAAERVAKRCGVASEAVADDLSARIGHTGCAHPLLMLAHVLERAEPGACILVAAFGQGGEAALFEATGAIKAHQPALSVEAQITAGRSETNYMRYLVFNDLVEWERGKRAERDSQTALTTLHRNQDMLTALVGGMCRTCGTRQFPASRVCVNPNCRAVDAQDPHSFADTTARIVSFSGDHVPFTPDPPLHYGSIAFEGGGRLMAEFTDCEPGDLAIGADVEMTFRIKAIDRARGFRRYFWKAVPKRAPSVKSE